MKDLRQDFRFRKVKNSHGVIVIASRLAQAVTPLNHHFHEVNTLHTHQSRLKGVE